jgi:hypothetical protein
MSFLRARRCNAESEQKGSACGCSRILPGSVSPICVCCAGALQRAYFAGQITFGEWVAECARTVAAESRN